MLVGYIRHSRVTEGGDGVQMALPSLSGAWFCPSSVVNTPSSVVASALAFGKSCNRNSSPRELGDGGVGFVSVSCFVLFLSLTCSAVAVASVTYTLSLASAECSHGTVTAAAQGAGCQDCQGPCQ